VRRVGIVGCGVIADAYARKLQGLDSVELVACSDLLRERAERLASKHAIPRVLEPDALLADSELDLVVNLTIPAAHAEVSRAALLAGKSVYAEKPLALDLEAGSGLLAESAANGVRLGCAPDTFLGAGLQTCRKLIDEGAIGTPVGALAFMLSPGPEAWHPGPQIFYQHGAGPLFDMGPYYFTALVHLLGPARRVTGAARMTHAKREIKSQPLRGQTLDVEVPTYVCATVELEAGPIASLTLSFDVQASRHRNIEIFGTEGTLAVPDPNTFGGPVQLRRSRAEGWIDVPLTHGNAEQSRGIGLADMVHAMESSRPHRASGELAHHVLELMSATLTASESGHHVALETTCTRPAPLPPGLPDDAVA
jgi:predicted dehydrogenase